MEPNQPVQPAPTPPAPTPLAPTPTPQPAMQPPAAEPLKPEAIPAPPPPSPLKPEEPDKTFEKPAENENQEQADSQQEELKDDHWKNPFKIRSATLLDPRKTVTITGSKMDILLHILFRFGFASIFLVNALYAGMHPEEFVKLLTENVIASQLSHADLMVKIAMFNDLFLGALILMGFQKKWVYAWAGGWLLMVAALKLMNLVI